MSNFSTLQDAKSNIQKLNRPGTVRHTNIVYILKRLKCQHNRKQKTFQSGELANKPKTHNT